MTRLVISFNRHFFYIACAAGAVGAALFLLIHQPLVRWVLGLGIAAAIYFMIASVIASYFNYDYSDLYKLQEWPSKSFPGNPASAVIIHAGFDPASGAFRSRYPQTSVRVLDFFTHEETTEASIQLAHRLNPPTGPQEHTALDVWPVETASQDAVMALSAAHEIRDDGRRVSFFREAKRVLRPGGRVVVIEQLRDIPNFLCFGVAAFHFLSRSTWLRSFRDSGLILEREFAITPFMRAFVLS
ncbi:MAG TPA: methyltransferase domain-containing protein [Pirellulales bacterium]|nr:methyltransferase domain-containing protein [Pirellulales bacterium]